MARQPSHSLRLAAREERAEALAYLLAYRRGSGTRTAERLAFQLAAEMMVENLELAGFVVTKKPPLEGHAAPDYLRAAGFPELRFRNPHQA